MANFGLSYHAEGKQAGFGMLQILELEQFNS